MTRFAWALVLLCWSFAGVSALAGPAAGERQGEPEASPSPSPSLSPSPSDTGHAVPLPTTPPAPVEIVKVRPDPFTPNGDRRRDTTKAVFRLRQPGEMLATVHRQNGKKVRFLARAPLGPGRYFVRWDGRGLSGGIIRPAIYRIRIRLTDERGRAHDDMQSVWLKSRG